MSLRNNTSFGASDCNEDENCGHYLVPQISTANGDNMSAYSQYIDHDQHFLPCQLSPSVSCPCGHEPDFTTLHGGAAIPTSQQQYATHISSQYDFSENFYGLPSSSYLPRSRFSMQLNSFNGTMEPQLMLKGEVYSPNLSTIDQSSNYSLANSNYSPGLSSATTASPPVSYSSRHDQYYAAPIWQHDASLCRTSAPEPCLSSLSDGMEDEEEASYDKPYAQLIHEALMEAPGHRMLLRDIYEWFIQHTRKPRDSGTNGWQNSIRHNLSMNQAFENDKNDPAASRGARKANSVWVLTEHAVKHGVQSTTRYRKTGASKKGVRNKEPAYQRQVSGAKGGRAARRTAARMKRGDEIRRQTCTNQSQTASPTHFNFNTSPMSTVQDQWSNYNSPVTPTEDEFFGSSYNLAHRLCYEDDLTVVAKHETEAYLGRDEELHQALSYSTSEDGFEDTARL